MKSSPAASPHGSSTNRAMTTIMKVHRPASRIPAINRTHLTQRGVCIVNTLSDCRSHQLSRPLDLTFALGHPPVAGSTPRAP